MVRTWIWVGIFLSLGCLNNAYAGPDDPVFVTNDPLKLSVLSGQAPLIVEITGPKELIERGHGTFQRMVGCLMYVDWGESPIPVTEKCVEHLTHTYQTPGKYKVTATMYHPRSDDGGTTDWQRSALVIVH